jgi:hypothetical protein
MHGCPYRFDIFFSSVDEPRHDQLAFFVVSRAKVLRNQVIKNSSINQAFEVVIADTIGVGIAIALMM